MKDKIFQMLRSAVPFHNLTEEELTELLPLLNPVLGTYEPGYCIARSNTPADMMCIIDSGQVVSQRSTFSGNVYVSKTYGPGSLIGPNGFYSSPGTWPLSYVTLLKSSLLIFSMQPFLPEGKVAPALKGKVCHALYRDAIDQENRRLIQDISRSAGSVRGKILTYLDLMQTKYGSVFQLRLKRDDLAALLDIARSSLFRELKLLAEEGIAVIERNGKVTIDNEKLNALHSVLHQKK
jgi:CRP-like cAMP-binding protein